LNPFLANEVRHTLPIRAGFSRPLMNPESVHLDHRRLLRFSRFRGNFGKDGTARLVQSTFHPIDYATCRHCWRRTLPSPWIAREDWGNPSPALRDGIRKPSVSTVGRRVESRGVPRGRHKSGRHYALTTTALLAFFSRFCASASSLRKIRIPLSTCFSCSRKGGKKRSTVSCVTLISRPLASAASRIGLPGMVNCSA